MKNPKKRYQRKALLKAGYTPWSEEEIDELSQVTPQDIEEAKGLVQGASPLLGKLLDAKQQEELEEGESGDQA